MGNFAEKVTFIWSVADLIRDHFKRGKYQDVILPFTVLRRIDCVREPTRTKVREVNAKLQALGLQNREPQLRKASGYAFYNTSLHDFDALLGDAPHLAANLRNYLAGFSPNMREVLEQLDFDSCSDFPGTVCFGLAQIAERRKDQGTLCEATSIDSSRRTGGSRLTACPPRDRIAAREPRTRVRRTSKLTCCRKREGGMSGRCRQSGAAPCWPGQRGTPSQPAWASLLLLSWQSGPPFMTCTMEMDDRYGQLPRPEGRSLLRRKVASREACMLTRPSC
ncbi:MAG: type I restriction-modification system subunit M N-terminal domain-containing protein [Candidatus Schekmanbacteria bacterium]|nr:type I restriction-modification system subunit M N-terminal domain-containing protein [Candidatus Schekmanbacteria bacterium]